MLTLILSNLKYVLQFLVVVFTYLKGKKSTTEADRVKQLERELANEKLARKASDDTRVMSDDELVNSVYKDSDTNK